jgi:hypothetical protein
MKKIVSILSQVILATTFALSAFAQPQQVKEECYIVPQQAQTCCKHLDSIHEYLDKDKGILGLKEIGKMEKCFHENGASFSKVSVLMELKANAEQIASLEWLLISIVELQNKDGFAALAAIEKAKKLQAPELATWGTLKNMEKHEIAAQKLIFMHYIDAAKTAFTKNPKDEIAESLLSAAEEHGKAAGVFE